MKKLIYIFITLAFIFPGIARAQSTYFPASNVSELVSDSTDISTSLGVLTMSDTTGEEISPTVKIQGFPSQLYGFLYGPEGQRKMFRGTLLGTQIAKALLTGRMTQEEMSRKYNLFFEEGEDFSALYRCRCEEKK